MKRIIIVFLTALITTTGFSQVNDELNTLIKQSFAYYPKIQELDKASEISEIRIGLAESGYLPAINGTASYSYVNPVGEATFPVSANETRAIQFQPNNNYNFNVGLTQVLWDFGKTQAQVEKAKADLLASKQNTSAAKFQLASQVVNIYYSLIYLKKAITLQDSVLGSYEANRKMIEGKIKHGDALLVDLANIDNTINQEKNRKVDFERQYARQVALLEYTTGQTKGPDNSEFDFVQNLGPDFSGTANPELMAAGWRLSAAQAEAKLAERNRLPSLNLQAATGVKNGFQPDIDEMRFNYLAGVTLSVPLFQGNRIRHNIAVARKSVELSDLSKRNLQSTLQKDWQSAQADLTAFQQQIRNSEVQIEAAREAHRLTQVRYDGGVATYVDLVFATTNFQRSLLNKLQYQYQACLAQAEMARLQGIPFWVE